MDKPKRVKKQIVDTGATVADVTDDKLKTKGRKPKGAKLISLPLEQASSKPTLSNIILHLKLSTKEYLEYINSAQSNFINEFQYNPITPPTIVAYNNDMSTTKCTVFNDENHIEKPSAYNEFPTIDYCKLCLSKMDDQQPDNKNVQKELTDKEINIKLRQLSVSLKTASKQKSACFWCTYEFDNPTCYIPKQETEGLIYVYGSFCRPECAVAYLLKEQIDDSVKFERLHLLNHIYGKIYGYTKSIRPAPNPHYMLEKFYGTLTIQEYRKLLKTNYMMLTIDKPMAVLIPDIYEETDEGLLKAGKQITYKVKRQSEQPVGQSKSNIVNNVFGILTAK
jgi:hypothetical protein